ncbi:uncharacterized protein BJX67DRAFT_361994 [Aspergillus lucknowensis]|uniref:RING-type domain-containing protein n=1 Tax=Aspergillus lucknowensis TaxID=176173 RepID=A0ABR4LLD3_9EURO
MPSSQTPSRPHLSTILSLYPEEEHWCVGFARTKGRRCHLPTNAHSRQKAVHYLDIGTERFYAGRNIDVYLEHIAVNVLCTRWHQNQASSLVCEWQGKVQRFLDSTAARERARRMRSSTGRTASNTPSSIRTPSRRASSNTTPVSSRPSPSRSPSSRQPANNNIPAEIDLVRQALNGFEARLGQIERVVGERNTRRPNAGTNVAGRMRRGTTQTAIQQLVNSIQSELNTTTDRRDVTLQISVSVTFASIPNDEDESGDENTEDGEHGAQDSATISPTVRARRRTIEGDCRICLEPLSGSRQLDLDGAEESLSWCQARCGVNYHAACINSWLAASTRATCPNCRSAWVL